MVSHRSSRSFANKCGRIRKAFSAKRRLEVAETRKIGACADCHRRKVRVRSFNSNSNYGDANSQQCFHASQATLEGCESIRPTSMLKTSSPQLEDFSQSRFTDGFNDYSIGVEDYGNSEGNLKEMEDDDSQLWANSFVFLPEIESESLSTQSHVRGVNFSNLVPLDNALEGNNQHLAWILRPHQDVLSNYARPSVGGFIVPIDHSVGNAFGVPDAWGNAFHITQNNAAWPTNGQNTANWNSAVYSSYLHSVASLGPNSESSMFNTMNSLMTPAVTFSPSSSEFQEPVSASIEKIGWNAWKSEMDG